jgi:hypothetical protein
MSDQVEKLKAQSLRRWMPALNLIQPAQCIRICEPPPGNSVTN